MKLSKANRKKALCFFNENAALAESIASESPEACRGYILTEWEKMKALLESESPIYPAQFQSRFDNWKATARRAQSGYFKSIEPCGNCWKFVNA